MILACAFVLLFIAPAQAVAQKCTGEANQPLCQIVGSNLVIIVEAEGILDDDIESAVQESTLIAKSLAIKVFNNLSCKGYNCQGVSSRLEMCPTLSKSDHSSSNIKTSHMEWKVICSGDGIVRNRLIWKKSLKNQR